MSDLQPPDWLRMRLSIPGFGRVVSLWPRPRASQEATGEQWLVGVAPEGGGPDGYWSETEVREHIRAGC